MTYGSCQRMCESNVHACEKPSDSARRVSSTTRLAGGSVWNVTPMSTASLRHRRGRRLLGGRERQQVVRDGGEPERDEHAVAVELVEEVRVRDHAALRRRRVQEA